MTSRVDEPPRQLRRRLLHQLYDPAAAERVGARIERLLDRAGHHEAEPRAAAGLWSERDAWLITYPDQFMCADEAPLATLDAVMRRHFEPWLNGLHVTPFYPWTSDDGFAVTDYLAVDARYGTWDDVERLSHGRRLVVDAVINHMSSQSEWFQRFLDGDPDYGGFFRAAEPDADLSAVVRPRATPLLTRFPGAPRGAAPGKADATTPVPVWTTFSEDQVDLDYRTPAVLERIVEVLLSYIDHGADVLRLDAVAFLWKEEATSCIHLPQTHAIIQFLRSCIDTVDPHVLLLTETNVPHEENVSYFGPAGSDEAHMVYQFPMPTLTLDALVSGRADHLRTWLASLEPPRPRTTFLNFLASHDGVGMRPAEGRLDPDAVTALADVTTRCGGQLGIREVGDGRRAVYELNATWYALMAAGYDQRDALRRHTAAHAVMFAAQGIPAIYVHSLVAGGNDQERFARTGRARALNRRRFTDVDHFTRALQDPGTRAGAAWRELRRMLQWRAASPAFHPDSALAVLDSDPAVLAIERRAATGARARVYVNVTERPAGAPGPTDGGWVDYATGSPWPRGRRIDVPAWSSTWLRTG